MKCTFLLSKVFVLLFVCLFSYSVKAQNAIGQNLEYRPITTAVPVLLVAPDARAAGMGDVGVATSPDVNSPYWNPAKLGFVESDFEASISYSPWLRNVVDDMYLAYLSAYKKLAPNSSLAVSFLYFDLGDIVFNTGPDDRMPFNPKEYAVSVSYGQKLSQNLSLGIGARYIRSNLAGNTNVTNTTGQTFESTPGNSASVDLGIYYNKDLSLGGKNINLALGGNISNVGGKISYSTAGRKDFLPTNLRLGTAITMELDPYNKITLAIDGNKLLVPYTQPDDPSVNDQTNVFSGIFKSFTDAPGGGSEELREIALATGLEYWYDNMFAARAGYFFENEQKGGRKYLSMGLGIRYQKFGVDAAYLVPNEQNNPLAQTLRFSLHFKLDGAE
ncbi:hypothetical protein EFA69_02430 [Rufibacter immobilis]|uniref:Type IX secretion system protein PorV domain-containing protein n=1 Tax=Rufibacter immobilis TaxID=1348778 RepID=A0A3M9N7J4_9BACT|nr:type IX secretion system outer membrane channel protein PorV [Rufibacter immobilis]RNI33287.1 hypothetical protein EFA69_02430 [Rufibacter immobilis]